MAMAKSRETMHESVCTRGKKQQKVAKHKTTLTMTWKWGAAPLASPRVPGLPGGGGRQLFVVADKDDF